VVIVPRPSDGRSRGEHDARGQPRILILDGQSLFTEALAGLLARPPLGAIARTINRSDHALQLLAEEPVDMVLCDVRIRPMGLRQFIAATSELPAPPPVVLLADVEDQDLLVGEIDSMAAGLFTKDADPGQFLDGVRAVLSGHRAIGANVMRQLIARVNGGGHPPVRPGLNHLSPTELGILAMVGAACSVEQIAQARGISQKTVRNHLANIYRKLDLRTRTEAMLCAARMGLTLN